MAADRPLKGRGGRGKREARAWGGEPEARGWGSEKRGGGGGGGGQGAGKREARAQGLLFAAQKARRSGLCSVKGLRTHSSSFSNLAFPYAAKAGALLAMAGGRVSEVPRGIIPHAR